MFLVDSKRARDVAFYLPRAEDTCVYHVLMFLVAGDVLMFLVHSKHTAPEQRRLNKF